jgi:phage terminase large subunit
MWRPGSHIVQPYPLPKDWYRICIIDPAPTGITAVLWGAADPKGNLILYREYYEKNLVVSDHAKGILIRNQGEPIDMWLIDPKGGNQKSAESHKTIAQLYRETGISVRLAELPPDYGVAISKEYVAATLDATSRKPGMRVFGSCTNFIWEIEHYVWANFGRGELKGLSKEKPIKKHDHLMNCFQYMAAQRPKGKASGHLPATAEMLSRQARANSYT